MNINGDRKQIYIEINERMRERDGEIQNKRDKGK